jgi:signal transduction histidine kinase
MDITQPDLATKSRLTRRGLALARAAWLVFCLLIAVAFGIGQWLLYAELQLPCGGVPCTTDQFYLTASEIATLRANGYDPSVYAGAQVILYVIFFVVHLGLATLIFWRRSTDRMALFVAFTLLIWSAMFPDVPRSMWAVLPGLATVLSIGSAIGGLGFYLFLFVFPNGRFAPPWMRWVALVMVLYAVLSSSNVLSWVVDAAVVAAVERYRTWLFMVFILFAIGTQLYRYRRLSDVVERQQTRWALYGIVIGLSWITIWIVYALLINPAMQSGALNKTLTNGLIYVGFLMVPLSIGMAILRARLWDIDLLINRTLVYGALTASVVGLYVLVVGYLGTLLQTSGNLFVSLVATGVVALLFQPLRSRLQRGVNRLIYGERDDPYAVLARLGQRLEATLAPDAVLPAIVETIAHALRLPYVAIALTRDEGQRTQDEPYTIVAEVGAGSWELGAGAASPRHPPTPISQLPLLYQGETIGQLILAPRAPGESLSPADQRLLDDLARQAGVAVHAVRLTSDLQRARERLVAAREEERRRLRRDLHDGLGPQLASQTLLIDTALRLLPNDLDGAVELLQRLKSQSQGAIADIRRLVYALRPPALDDLGLVEALREQAMQYVQSDVQIVVVAPSSLPPLPAAVEVAVYRIAQEALTNVIRHAQARMCTIEIVAGPELVLSIADDGRGLPADRRMGVGLSSMHERAAELGGRLAIEPRLGGGTQVRAWLPLA